MPIHAYVRIERQENDYPIMKFCFESTGYRSLRNGGAFSSTADYSSFLREYSIERLRFFFNERALPHKMRKVETDGDGKKILNIPFRFIDNILEDIGLRKIRAGFFTPR